MARWSRTSKYRVMAGLSLAIGLLITTPVHSVEVRLDPYRLWQGLEGWADEGPVMFDLAIDVPLESSMWGPQFSYYEDDAGSFQTIGVQWNRMMERTSSFYWGGGLNWLQIVPSGEVELEDVCRPAVPLNATGRWGYRWQVNPVFNVQVGANLSAGEVTGRQGERCATDGLEVDLGAVQNVVDPRFDFKFSLRL